MLNSISGLVMTTKILALTDRRNAGYLLAIGGRVNLAVCLANEVITLNLRDASKMIRLAIGDILPAHTVTSSTSSLAQSEGTKNWIQSRTVNHVIQIF